MKHLVFFDTECKMCRSSVGTLIKMDKHKKLLFAPLNGKTADDKFIGKLSHIKHQNSLVLIESPNGHIWLRGRAVFRILWLLGGEWKWVGWLYMMPFVDFFYRQVAKHRHRIFRKDDLETIIKKEPNRFLP